MTKVRGTSRKSVLQCREPDQCSVTVRNCTSLTFDEVPDNTTSHGAARRLSSSSSSMKQRNDVPQCSTMPPTNCQSVAAASDLWWPEMVATSEAGVPPAGTGDGSGASRFQRWYRQPRRTGVTTGCGLWRSLFQQQLVLVLAIVVLVFSGIDSVVHCDENVTGGVVSESGPVVNASPDENFRSADPIHLLTADTVVRGSKAGVSDDGDGEASFAVKVIDDGLDGASHFTHHWAVHIPDGDGQDLANRVAAEHGFINRGKIFHDHYHFEHGRLHKRSLSPSKPHQRRLETDQRVRWARQQRAKSRQKRDYRPLGKLPYQLPFLLNDPKWPEMWYLNRGNGLDMNVIPAWKEGVTGKGVVVTILDDGLESDHPDLEHNYDPKASYDVNSSDNDPMPHYDLTDSNRHGTRCAGEVAATANNSKCAVGIAFGARVGGVRMLDGDVTDIVEARSLGYNSQHIDIYSASWGPDDDGKTVDGPGELTTRAFIEGVRNGRAGKGSIFIWASGNGGREHDNCNCDGYTNSIWTLSISSASQEGLVPWFSEMCSSTLATTYSSGNTNEKQVITTDLHHTCTSSHTGTSASAPLAAGIAALVLEANRNLTWRDLQHIVVRTAKPGNLSDPNWSVNGVGRRVSHSFGYGLMDAAAMVRVARNWKTVPEQQVCEINARHLDKQIPPRTKVTLQLIVEHCMGVNYLEHVQAKITLTSQRRGDIQIFLTSPSGTRVTLLTPRSHDLSRSGFNQWPFMSVHTWGEAPHGTWQLEIHNEGRLLAQITQWDLIFYGTETPAQPNDPVRFGKPGYDSNFGGEMEHNALEFDSGVTSDQWRDMQQIGEGHGEVQRTASNDVTAVSCARFVDAASCIACKPQSYLYKGRCYLRCPPGTFSSAAPQQPSAADDGERPTNIQQQPLPASSLRKRRQQPQQVFDEASPQLSSFQAIGQEASASASASNKSSDAAGCLQCHTTCLKCSGPGPTECIECQAAFRFEPAANGTRNGSSAICVSINAKRPPSAESGGRLKGLVRPGASPPATAPDDVGTSSKPSSSYFVPLLFLGLVLTGAFGVIYLLWLRCFQGSPGGGSMLEELTSAADGGSSGLASIRYDRVQTNEDDDDDNDQEEVDSGASSGDDDMFSISTEIIAPIER